MDLFNNLNPQITWLRDRTIFITRHGSHAYGTNTPESDEDFRGVAIPPQNYFLGFTHNFDQYECHTPDFTIWGIKKFMNLAVQNNPNVLEILFTDPKDHIYVSDIGRRLLERKEEFISRQAKERFLGYAKAQAHRIKTHKRWISNPPAQPPTRAEFGLPENVSIPKPQFEAVLAAVRKKVDSWNVDFDPFTEAQTIYLQSKLAEILTEMQIASDTTWAAAARTLGMNENFIHMLQREREYEGKQTDWQHFKEWKKSRNPKRAALEEKYGYDCYSADTEFLTKNGWKLFDDIDSQSELATVFISRGLQKNEIMEHRAPLFGVEYQCPTERFDAKYNGTMYHFVGQHTDTLVTANHRMLYRKVERNTGVEFNWELDEASYLPDTFDVVMAPTPKKKNHSNKNIFGKLPIQTNAYMTLMGWYLSDGTAQITNGLPKSIRISQKPGGKIAWAMSRWNGDHGAAANSSLYKYMRKSNSYNPVPHEELVLDVRNSNIVTKMIAECGYKNNKRIPRWAFNLSQSLMERTLYALIGGDGTARTHKTKANSFIYYSKSKELADDVQELAFHCGWETAVWGPYPNEDIDGRKIEMYHVHLRKDVSQFKRLIRNQNVKKINVQDYRIVCFSVPNGTLITRRNGKIAIHGNCKHGGHLVRLTRMAKEILLDGKVIVKRPDAEELLSIRNGAWSYARLIAYTEQIENEIRLAYNNSPIRAQPDREALDTFCNELVLNSFAI